MSLHLVMSYNSVLSFAAKLTNTKDALCVGTMRGRGYNVLLHANQAKIVEALTCDLCSKVHPWLLGSLRSIKGGFETIVSN